MKCVNVPATQSSSPPIESTGSTNETFVCCSCGQLTNWQKKGNRSIHKSAVAVAACVEGGFSDKLSLPFPLLVCKGCAAVVQNAVHMARWGLPSCSAFSKNIRGRNAATEATSVISHRGTTLRDALNKMWKVVSMRCALEIYRRTQMVSQSTIS